MSVEGWCAAARPLGVERVGAVSWGGKYVRMYVERWRFLREGLVFACSEAGGLFVRGTCVCVCVRVNRALIAASAVHGVWYHSGKP